MNTQTILIAAAVAFIAYRAGQQAAADKSAPQAHNDIATQSDWWSYAGSWAI